MAVTFHDVEALAINLESQERRELIKILLGTFGEQEFRQLELVWERERDKRSGSD